MAEFVVTPQYLWTKYRYDMIERGYAPVGLKRREFMAGLEAARLQAEREESFAKVHKQLQANNVRLRARVIELEQWKADAERLHQGFVNDLRALDG